ncbi:phospho-N-acetylmuramoyl-pentapeptide-transferase [Thermosipho melanesiensis]|nr:phospho-N-acetylmuramoyl-pentapeptide-transferase [Thermosipho melanesiensis]APT73678.1 phospho-N-acetylmuramoyl-pentapeptide-transferase [Thermosipho melanesiensis]OOC36749.1 phospho-N-acetylmuramoyl-pentapeptide-transferase [Thermosipho melanesiensis]OOC39325.1 phospho-N-acetylmuramoyl-pentapeptide-transferase [Thermosipho melanesiensis]OOC39411.1 phospho-N-acetylmuramoyl-pentapeptide-transferase [Thermosipho melanesiensis]OOC41966.1 phospho-N-acetylmuramoyl-pentapeptide-transferase [Ther
MYLLSFFSSAILTFFYINFMRKLKLGQYIREEGPDLHNYKTGTPTAGGVVFIIVALIFGINKMQFPLVLSLLLFGGIGFLDDISSILKKQALGLRAYQKFFLQIIFSILIISYSNSYTIFGTNVSKITYYIFWTFVITGASNAVNLTDGLDGLAGWVWITSILPLSISTKDFSTFFLISSVLAFLLFNTRPASLFMGDTGSLALGAFLSTYAMIHSVETQLIFSSSIFIVETLSVILQVISFKLFKKRIFKMSPIHHHFELLGWKEEKIVGVFSAINLIVSLSIIGW